MIRNYCGALLALILSLPIGGEAAAAKIRIKLDTPAGLEQKIYLGRSTAQAPDRPIVFVLHGMQRNADEYRDQWFDLAIEHDFLLVVPEFSERHFPEARSYNLGNVADAEGRPRPRREWSFSAIEPIFDEVKRRYGMTAKGYAIYGHSAGAQFVHRFLFHVPNARVVKAVAANAGWYTMPVFNVDWPYGLRNSAVTSPDLAAALQLPVTVLLGDADTDPEHQSLLRTPEALAQGPHRYARGLAFFETASKAAGWAGVPFAWQLATVPGADHDNTRMAPAAVPYLLYDVTTPPPAAPALTVLPQTGR